MNVASLLNSFPARPTNAALGYFTDLVDEYRRGEWEAAIAKAGKFVEAMLKAVGSSCGLTIATGKAFKVDNVINSLAQLPAGAHSDSLRLTIPRAARVVYDIASNRGGRHDADEIDPNQMDASVSVSCCSWIVAEMIRNAQKGAVDMEEAKAAVEALAERKYPSVEEVEGRVYLHLTGKSAVDVALALLAYRHPKRVSRKDLLRSISRNGFSEANSRTALRRISHLIDSDDTGGLKLLAPGLMRAEEILQRAGSG
jgi:hypothetical protein